MLSPYSSFLLSAYSFVTCMGGTLAVLNFSNSGGGVTTGREILCCIRLSFLLSSGISLKGKKNLLLIREYSLFFRQVGTPAGK